MMKEKPFIRTLTNQRFFADNVSVGSIYVYDGVSSQRPFGMIQVERISDMFLSGQHVIGLILLFDEMDFRPHRTVPLYLIRRMAEPELEKLFLLKTIK